MRANRPPAVLLLIALLVGSCSLPTFNPPKLKTMVGPRDGAAGVAWRRGPGAGS